MTTPYYKVTASREKSDTARTSGFKGNVVNIAVQAESPSEAIDIAKLFDWHWILSTAVYQVHPENAYVHDIIEQSAR